MARHLGESCAPAEQRSGGSSPLEELYREAYAPMVRLAYLLTGNAGIAEDLVQDSFARLSQHWAGLDRPEAYLRVTVVNASRDYHRRAGRERAHFADLAGDQLSPETPVLADALARLPYRQRVVLVLRFYEDRPETHIAELLGCRPATVRSLARRGLQALRKVIEP